MTFGAALIERVMSNLSSSLIGMRCEAPNPGLSVNC
jgi:hypothetical protein